MSTDPLTIAIDCDLRRLHGLTNRGEVLFYNEPDPIRAASMIAHLDPHVLLYEVASPVHYREEGGNKGAAYNYKRWALFNLYALGIFSTILDCEFLVSPSSDWTLTHEEKTRHLIAECVQPNHDLREAEAMLYFYRFAPSKWVPINQYIEDL